MERYHPGAGLSNRINAACPKDAPGIEIGIAYDLAAAISSSLGALPSFSAFLWRCEVCCPAEAVVAEFEGPDMQDIDQATDVSPVAVRLYFGGPCQSKMRTSPPSVHMKITA